jgi:hypothetical protein
MFSHEEMLKFGMIVAHNSDLDLYVVWNESCTFNVFFDHKDSQRTKCLENTDCSQVMIAPTLEEARAYGNDMLATVSGEI